MSLVRVLVVDDFKPIRQFVCAALGKIQDLQVVGEASDGLEAIRKAVELKPDLILLDIGLPTLNGFEAAREIRQLLPECKIIFLSQESSADVIQEAVSLGAWDYVVKARAASEAAHCCGRGYLGEAVSQQRIGKLLFTFPFEAHSWLRALDGPRPAAPACAC